MRILDSRILLIELYLQAVGDNFAENDEVNFGKYVSLGET